MTSTDDLVIQLAIERGLLDQARVEHTRRRAAEGREARPMALLDQLIASGAVSSASLAEAVADECGLPLVDLREVKPSPEALRAVPAPVARKLLALPLAKQARALEVAVADPLDVEVVDELARVVGGAVELRVADRAMLQEVIERLYGEVEAPGAIARAPAPRAMAVTANGSGEVSDEPVIRLVHELIARAVDLGASDIHVEPLERRLRVRYRIDGVLREQSDAPQRLQAAILSRLKLMAGISIAEKRVPQDGRIQFGPTDRPLDLRVSSLPTVYGESIVMRLLDPAGLRLGLPELGFWSDDQAVMEGLLGLADGLVLVTGPTGSGKTTTLYSCLHYLNRSDRKIITVEDPVEYQLCGINQVPVRHDVGMTFGSALRAILRQAPNIVMVGEIRDRETAEIAVNAALTGHLVFSTLHTNDAPSAATRLIDLGVKPFLVAAALRAVVAQRLVRQVCRDCGEEAEIGGPEASLLGLNPANFPRKTGRKGRGCVRCLESGYRGRLGLFEIMVVSEPVSAMIHHGSAAARLRDAVRSQGMRTMREDGLRKAVAGVTTFAEVASATLGDTA